MVLVEVLSKLKTFVWILNHISRLIAGLSVHPKSMIILDQSQHDFLCGSVSLSIC